MKGLYRNVDRLEADTLPRNLLGANVAESGQHGGFGVGGTADSRDRRVHTVLALLTETGGMGYCGVS